MIAGYVVAVLGALLMLLQLGAVVVIVGVFALAGDESVFALGLAAAWVAVAVVVVVTLVLARRGRAWPRIVLTALAVAAGAYAISIANAPVGAVLVVAGVVLLSLPSAQQWLQKRADAPRAPAATPVAPPIVGERLRS